jgi:hypothetical protein
LPISLPSGLFTSGFPNNILYSFLFSPFVLHVLPISSSLIWSLYLAKDTSYEVPHFSKNAQMVNWSNKMVAEHLLFRDSCLRGLPVTGDTITPMAPPVIRSLNPCNCRTQRALLHKMVAYFPLTHLW